MKRKTPEQYAARARVAKALAHPTRLLLLDALKGGEHCVGDLTELAGVDQSTVSKHLAVLRDAGLVSARKEGQMTYYGVRCPCLEDFFVCIERVLRDNLRTYRVQVAG